MAQPERSGLSNPYASPPGMVPARSRTGIARAAVLAGVGGAAALGLAGPGTGSAWADTSTAAPVSRYDRDTGACMPLRDPVLHDNLAYRTAPVVLPRRCGVPVSWWRQRPVDQPVPKYPAPLPEPVAPPGDPVAGSRSVSVEGTVEAGVEPGCEVLRDGEGRPWTLIGPLRTLPYGVPLTVEGVIPADVLTHCQQGDVLQVRQVSLLDPGTGPGRTVPIATTGLLTAEARPVPVSPVYTGIEPACGPTGTGKVPSMTLCTR